MKIAVIEDEPEIRTMMCEEFSELGYDVKSAADGAAGIELIASWRPDIILSDVNMPSMNGFQMKQHLEKLDIDVASMKFIFVSAQTSDDIIADGLMLGASHYIKKPIDFERLHSIIAES